MKKIFLIAAIAVAGVAAWAASDVNAFKADEADAGVIEVMAYGKYLGDSGECNLTDGYITYNLAPACRFYISIGY